MANHTIFAADGSAANRRADDTEVAVADRPAAAVDWDDVEQANMMINPDPASMDDRG